MTKTGLKDYVTGSELHGRKGIRKVPNIQKGRWLEKRWSRGEAGKCRLGVQEKDREGGGGPIASQKYISPPPKKKIYLVVTSEFLLHFRPNCIKTTINWAN